MVLTWRVHLRHFHLCRGADARSPAHAILLVGQGAAQQWGTGQKRRAGRREHAAHAARGLWPGAPWVYSRFILHSASYAEVNISYTTTLRRVSCAMQSRTTYRFSIHSTILSTAAVPHEQLEPSSW